MKRFLSLFTLLMLIATTAFAQRIVSIGDEVTDGNFNTHDHYVIKLVSYYTGTTKTDITDDKYFYTTGARMKLSTINTTDYTANNSTNNFLVNLQATNYGEGVYALGLGTHYVPSFTSGSGAFNCQETSHASINYAYKFVKQTDGTYKMQGYRGTAAGMYLNYNSTDDQVEVTSSEATAMLVKVYKANTPFDEGKFYTLTLRGKEGGNRNVVLSNGLNINTQAAATTDPVGIWYFKKQADVLCKWYLCNAETGTDFGLTATTTNNSRVELTQAPTPFSVGLGQNDGNKTYTQEGGFSLISDGNATLNDVSASLGIWNNTAAPRDGGSSFMATAVEGDYALCTFNFTDAAHNLSVTRHTYRKVGEVPAIPSVPYFTATTTSLSTAVASDGENTYTINGTFSYPFAINDADDATSWYAINVRPTKNPTGRDIMISSDNKIYSRITFTNEATTYTKFNDGMFRFVKVGNTGFFKIKSRNGKYFKWNTATTSGNTLNKVDLITTSDESAASAFMIIPSPATGAPASDLDILPVYSQSTSQYVCGDHGDNYLTIWTGDGNSKTDDGSRFRIKDVSTTTDLMTLAATLNITDKANAAPSTVLGGYTDAAIAAFKTASYGSLTAMETAANTLHNTASNLQTPVDGQLYRINFIRGNVTAAATNAIANADGTVQNGEGDTPNERLLKLVAGTTNTPSALVRFHKNGDNYTIEDVNSGYYYGTYSNDKTARMFLAPTDNNDKGQFSIVNTYDGTVGHIALKETSVSDDSKRYLWSCGSSEDEALNSYPYVRFHSGHHNDELSDENIENGCVLSVQKVTTYPISISAAGYASMCLPFSVTLPEGLTANKVTAVSKNNDEQNELSLENIGTTIAAGEPVILQGNAADYTLTINTDNGTKSEGNILTGATVKRTGITDTYYALAYKALNSDEADNKTAGFFRVETGNMPANKAYLLKKSIPAEAQMAAMFYFNFNGNGGEVTNINATQQSNTANDNVYYDLNGHRVLYPTHGIYVKSNGQKVFIK